MKTTWKPLIFMLGSAALPVVFTSCIWAQEDPPSRVGRLSYVQGQVSFEPAGVEQWAPAELNRPLSTGDHLWADSDGRAVIQLGSAAIHLNAQSSFSFLNLNDRTVQIRLAEGDLNVRVRHLFRDEAFEIDTPNAAVSILHAGEYRLQARPDGNYTIVMVRNGEAELTGGRQSLSIRKHQLVQVTGTDALAASWSHVPERDGFDRFCESRMHREERSMSARYVSSDMVGYEDLDDNGSWRDAPGYGHVWFPRVAAAGWTPYHDGHWAWVDPWGWTWVDDAPWGFAPFHYGRWASVGGDWGWVPGPMAAEPVYAPALVGFVGEGEQVGWFPLGPGEVYTPGYHASADYWDHVNHSNTVINKSVNVTKIYNNTNNSVNNSNNTNNSINHSNVGNQRYVNQMVPGAVTAVPQSAFASGQPVAKAAVAMTPRQAAGAQVMSAAAIPPRIQAVAPPGGGTQVARPPASSLNRAVMTKQTPPPPPVSFAQRQQAQAATAGRPLASTTPGSLRPNQPGSPVPTVTPAGANLGPGPSAGSVPSPSARLNQPPSVPPPPTVTPRINNPDRAYRPASVQPNVTPRASNPDRPSSPASVQPMVTPRASNPVTSYKPASVQPTVVPRGSNTDRPYQPASAQPAVSSRVVTSYQPPSVQPTVAPRTSSVVRNNPPASVQHNAAPHATNPPRPVQPVGAQARAVTRPASSQPTQATPHVSAPPPATRAAAHAPPPPPSAQPQPKKDDKSRK